MADRRVHLRVRGLVQGVSYRASARDEAARLGLLGWVRNLANGDVEAVAQGADPSVTAFIAWCKHGPDEAQVESVAIADELPAPDLRDFQVHR